MNLMRQKKLNFWYIDFAHRSTSRVSGCHQHNIATEQYLCDTVQAQAILKYLLGFSVLENRTQTF